MNTIKLNMCKYCEKDIKTKMVSLLIDQDNFMACLGHISPIAERRYPDMTGELHIHFGKGNSISIPIKYCPICGKKL